MDHRTCLAFLVAGGLAAATAAQPPGLVEFRVDTEEDPATYLQWVDVDVEPGGDMVMVWDTVKPGIFARRFASNGEPASDELHIDTGLELGFVNSVVASLGGGAFVVVWERLQAGDRDVVGQLFSSSGEPASEVFPVHAEAAGTQLTPDLASDHEGGFVVIWLKYDNDGDHELLARRFTSAGVPATGDLAISIANNLSGEPAVASDADGDFVVVWLNEVVDEVFGSHSRAFFRRYSSAGEPLSAALPVSFEGEQRNPAVASEPDGDFVVVWSGGVPLRSETVYARRFAESGEPLTADVRVADGEWQARVASDADGNFLVIWRGDQGYFGRHFSAAGEPQGGEFRINQVAAYLGKTSLAGDLAGNFVAAWERDVMAFARLLPLNGRAGTLHFSPEPPNPVVPGMIEFGAIEGDRTVPVKGVIRTGGALGEVSVDYFTEPGSAEPGEDYLTAAGTLVFGEDDSRVKTFGVEILEDEEVETDETLTVRLTNPQGGAPLVGSPTARVGIFSDDFNPPELAPVPLGRERVVNTQRRGPQVDPQVAVSPEGEFVVVWESRGEGIFVQLFDRDAAPQGQEFQVSGLRPAFQQHPSVAFDNQGGFLVVWQSFTAGGASVFLGRRFSGDGQPQSQAFEIARADGCVSNPFPDCHLAGPGRLAAGIDGRFPAVWGIVHQTRYSSSAQVWSGILGSGAAVTASDLGFSGNNFRPDIAAGRDGGFVAAWFPGFGSRITARRFDRAGQPVGEDFEIASEGAGWYSQVNLAMSDDGQLTAGWQQAEGVVVRGFARSGRPLSELVPVPQFSLGGFQGPVLGADPAGNVVAVWVQGDPVRGFEEDGSGSGIFARRFDAGLAPVGGEFPVNLTTAFDQRNPAVAVGRDGRFMVVWESEEEKYGDTDVMARAFAPAGCVAHGGSLCFQNGRFQVEVEWRDFGGNTGAARHVTLADSGPAQSDDSGLFYFFSEENWEMLVKVLDGCAVNGHFWVFAATATDVEYTLRVTDTASNTLRTYFNPLRTDAAAITDTRAFDACP